MNLESAYATMDIQSNSIVKTCYERYQEVLREFQNVDPEGSKVIVSHFGEFSQDLVNSLSTKVEETLIESGIKKGIVKRMFSILVEGLQNIRLHGARDEDANQVSFVVIARAGEEFKVTFGNLLKKSSVEVISDRLTKLNEMEPAKVKEHYMDVLTNGIMSNKGGAGLGFITIAMKAKNKLGFSMEPIDDDFSCFIMSTSLSVKKKKS